MDDPRRLINPHLTPTLVDAQATHYPNMIQIYIPKHPILRNPTGVKKTKHQSLEEEAGIYEKEKNQERSIRRAKKKTGDYILCNSFDLFATFTIRDDRQNSDHSKQKVLNWLKNQRNRKGKFQYVIVPEFHKDLRSLHFHALLGNYTGTIEKAINPKTGHQLKQHGRNVSQIGGYTLGFTNVMHVNDKPIDRSKLSAYLKKYITKDMPSFHGRQRYWASKGLILPELEDNPDEWYKHATPDWIQENDNGTIMRFDLNKNALVDIISRFKD